MNPSSFSGTDLLALEFVAYVIGGLALLATLYALWLLRSAHRQRTAIRLNQRRSQAFDWLMIGLPGLIVSSMSWVLISADPVSLPVILAVGIGGIATFATLVWFLRKAQRASEEFGDAHRLELEAEELRDGYE